MVGKACLPSCACFHGHLVVPHLFVSMSACLNMPNVVFVCVHFMIFLGTVFSVLASDSFSNSCFFKILSQMANSKDPDQTAP